MKASDARRAARNTGFAFLLITGLNVVLGLGFQYWNPIAWMVGFAAFVTMLGYLGLARRLSEGL